MTHLVFSLAAAVLTAAFLFGGGASLGSPGDLVPQMLSLPLLYCVAGPGWRCLREAPLVRLWILGALGLVLFQLVPLPPDVWAVLPGRAPILAMLEAAGATKGTASTGWMSLSMRPPQTLKVFLGLLPLLALFLAVLVLDLKRRLWLLGVLLGLILLSIVLGVLQVLNGLDSPLYFYQFTNRGRAVGFFANPNHFTAPFYVALPLIAALAAGVTDRLSGVWAGAFAAAAFACLVGLSTSGSRTALLLGGVSLVAALILLARSGVLARLPGRRRLLAASLVMGGAILPVLMGVGLLAILDRVETQDVFDDLRWRVLPEAIEQGQSYWPFGAGLGTFERVYALNESLALLIPSYVNHVHNDWAEVFFEAGLGGTLLMGLAVLIVLQLSLRALLAPRGLMSRLQAAAAVGIWLLLAHSLWDYPLRTQACLAILAVLLGLLLAREGANVATLDEVLPGARRRKLKRSGTRYDRPTAAEGPTETAPV